MGAGKQTIRREAEGIRWSDEAYLQKKGEDHQEDRSQAGVHQVQVQAHCQHQAHQALRAGRRHQEEGRGPDLRWEVPLRRGVKALRDYSWWIFFFVCYKLLCSDAAV